MPNITKFITCARTHSLTHANTHHCTHTQVLCGSWAGATFMQTCPGLGTCEEFCDKHPEMLQEAYWEVNYVAIYNSTSF